MPKFRKQLGFSENVIDDPKEITVSEATMDTFQGKDMKIQYNVLGYRIGFYFHGYKLAIEVDEFRHIDRGIYYGIKRQKAIEEWLGCEFIRINPNEHDFDFLKP